MAIAHLPRSPETLLSEVMTSAFPKRPSHFIVVVVFRKQINKTPNSIVAVIVYVWGACMPQRTIFGNQLSHYT